jgi:colanic acid biosynthesis glycosyl transferase WcaI
MSKKLLLISQVFYPDQVSTANLFTNLCTVLAKEESIEIEVWAGHPSYTESKRQPGNVNFEGVNIKYLPSSNFPKTIFIGRILNVLTFTATAGLKILFSSDKIPVWTHTTPPFLGILLAFICSVKKRKFVYILLDIFPEGIIRLGKVSKENPFIKIWHYLFLKALRRTDKIIVIGRDMKSWLEQECPECKDYIEYIPHWQDERLLFPVEFNKNKLVIEKNLNNKFVVQYSGNFGLWNEVKTMGRAAMQNIENVVFIFVGGGMRKNEFINEISPGENQNTILLPFQHNENFNNVITAAHVHLVTFREGLEGMAVPSKIYGIMAAGIPIIAMVPELSEIAYIVQEENCGVVLEPCDLEGLINTILMFKRDETLRKLMGQNSRKAFENKYTTSIIADRYKRVLDELYLQRWKN